MSRVGAASPSTGGGDAELREIHQKMSRKIAQLTKVIYTLNTKNEDSDAKIKYLTQKHESEILAERAKSSTILPPAVDTELTERLKIENQKLQTNVSELATKVSGLRSDCDTIQLQSAQSLQLLESSHNTQKSGWDAEKHQLLENIKKLKQNSNLKDRIKELEEDLRHQKELFEKDIGSLRIKNSNLKSEAASHISKLDEENNQKIEKLKAIHIRELKLAKGERDDENEKLVSSTKNIQKLEKQLELQSSTILKLQKEAKDARRSFDDGRKEKSELNQLLDELHAEQDELRSQLESSNISKSQTENKLSQNVAQLDHALHEIDIKHRLVVEKVARIGELDGEMARLEATLKVNKKALYEADLKLSQLQKNKSETHNSASKKIQDLTLELEKLKDKMKDETTHLNQIISEKSGELEEADLKRKNDEKDFERRMKENKSHYDTLLAETKENLNQQFDIERENISKIHLSTLEKEKSRAHSKLDNLQVELEQSREEFKQRIQEAEKQIEELKTVMESENSKSGLLNGQIEYLRKREKDLENVKIENSASIQKLQESLNSSQKQIEELNFALSNEENLRRIREDKIGREATGAEREKWENEIKKQLDVLRNDLSTRLNQERLEAISTLTRQKNEEMEASRKGWESSLAKLAQQLAQMEDTHAHAIKQKSDEIENINLENLAELDRLKSQFNSQLGEIEKAKNKNDRSWKNQVREVEEKMIKERRIELEMLESSAQNERVQMMESQRISIDALKSKLEENHQRHLKQIEQEHKEAIELLHQRLEEQHQIELEEECKRQEEEMLEVENHLEKEKKNRKREKEDLDDQIELQQRTVQGLQASIQRANQQIQNQLEENQKLLIEIDCQRRTTEEKLLTQDRILENSKKDAEMDKENSLNECIADGLRRRQTMLNDFNKAQDLLKAKINDLAKQLGEAEDRFNHRESLEEDIDMINHLQRLVGEREGQIEKLHDEMKFYQLELVNREQNYNTVFSSNPTVGLLNPLGGSSVSNRSAPRSPKPLVSKPGGATQRPARFSDHFVRIDPALFADQLPPNRLEPISNKKTVKNTS